MRKLLLVFAALVPGLLIGQVAVSAANSPAQIVTCVGFAGCFSPNPIRVTVGSAVAWTNNSRPTHTATADTSAWDTGNIANGQTSALVTFNTVGTFTYHCKIHPNMVGSIIVTAAVTTTPVPTARATSAPVTQRLAQSGGGPVPAGGTGSALPIGAGLALLGLGALAAGRRHRQRLQGAGEIIDESSDQ